MKILWIDDSKISNAFRNEQEVIEEQDWEIEWAISISEAANKLSTKEYDVIFLDQQFPFEGRLSECDMPNIIPEVINKKEHDIWAGNTIFAWLFDYEEDLNEAPPQVRENFAKIKQNCQPKDRNKLAKILILSVNRPTHYATGSRLDVKRPPFYTKPLDVDELLVYLDEVRKEKE